ncbi:MAG: DUF3231 family protein, partial [Desulfitobacteriaceae bacterium]|nr:DUF3231 family protein [Desulfitobacteriaceae bacterium]
MTKIEQMNLLNANEITDLWISFDLVNSIHYVAETFKSNVQDETIKSLVELWYSKSKEHMDKIVSIFKQENIPHSQGITQEDVNLNIPRLFSDKFYLFYAKLMSQAALSAHCRSFTMATRSDIRQLYSEFVDDLQYMDEQLTQVLNSTGLYTPPIVPYPESITFVKQQSFLAGFFTEKRSLTVMEVRHLFQNALSNALGKALLTGFMQV